MSFYLKLDILDKAKSRSTSGLDRRNEKQDKFLLKFKQDVHEPIQVLYVQSIGHVQVIVVGNSLLEPSPL